MAVGFRSSSRTGQSDSFGTSCAIPVPSGAAANDIAVVALEQWESTNPTVTYPANFTQVINLASGSQKLKAAWKRLTGADSGNYTCSWTGSQWNQGQAILITGAITSGSPIDATNTATATSTTVPTTTVTTTQQDFLVNLVANENAATKAPATNFTETQDADYLETSYRIPGASGSQSASGGTTSTSTLILAALIAILPDTGGSTQNVGLQVISTSSTISNPTVVPGSVTVALQVINTSSTILSPKILQLIAAPLLTTNSTIHSPAVIPGAITAVLPVLNTSSVIFDPQVIQFISTPTLNTSSTVHDPSVELSAVTVVVPVIDSPSSIGQPTVINAGFINFDVINTATTIFAPTVISLLSLIQAPIISSSSTIFNPTVLGGGSPPVMAGSLADIARVNMLADRGLSPPRLESNSDLMQLVLADGGQVLVPKTEASVGTHLLRYMMSLRT